MMEFVLLVMMVQVELGGGGEHCWAKKRFGGDWGAEVGPHL